MEKYIMALDQGTTSSRCIIFDKAGNIVSTSQQEFENYYPHPGWVEQDAEEIWSSQLNVAKEALAYGTKTLAGRYIMRLCGSADEQPKNV